MPTVITTPLSRIPQFDPRKVPVVAVDHHLPAVAPEQLHPQALAQRFANPPPWQPEIWRELSFSGRQPAKASVLVGIVCRDQPTLLLTERTHNLSTHSGQIAFAGGKQDEADADASATALREAQEEVGLDPHFVQVLGSLPHYVTGTAFTITPVVALIDPAHQIQANPDEVAAVFEVPLAFLMNPANHRHHRLEWEGQHRDWLSMPWMDGTTERYIWGATAGMLRNLYRFLIA